MALQELAPDEVPGGSESKHALGDWHIADWLLRAASLLVGILHILIWGQTFQLSALG